MLGCAHLFPFKGGCSLRRRPCLDPARESTCCAISCKRYATLKVLHLTAHSHPPRVGTQALSLFFIAFSAPAMRSWHLLSVKRSSDVLRVLAMPKRHLLVQDGSIHGRLVQQLSGRVLLRGRRCCTSRRNAAVYVTEPCTSPHPSTPIRKDTNLAESPLLE